MEWTQEMNKMDGGNTIFTAGGGKLSMVTQVTNTKTKALYTTTTIHLKDDNGKPVPDTILSLWADSHTPAYINGLYYVLGKKAITIPTDQAGNITVIEATADMDAAVLSVRIPRDTETIVINPMETAFSKMALLDTAQKLKDADYPVNVVAGGIIGPAQRKKLLDPSVGSGDLDTIARSMGSLKEVWNQVKPPPKTQKLFFDNDSPPVIPSQGFETSSGDVSDANVVWIALGDLWNWLKSGINAVIKIVKDVATGVWHFVAEIADKAYKAVLDAVDAVMGAIEWIFNQIKTAVEEIIHFLEFLFDWDDIKRTKDVLHNFAKLFLRQQVNRMDSARVVFDEKVDEIAETVAKWGGISYWSSLGGVAEKPAVGSAADPFEGHNSGSLLFANHFQNQVSKIQVKSVLPQVSAEAADLIDILLEAISEEGEVLSGVYQELQTLASKFNNLNVEEVIKAIAAILVKGVLSSVKVVASALFRVLASLADTGVELLDAKLHIPIISDILNAIGIPDISFLDLITWIGAVGYTVVYKALNQKPPFPDNGDVKAIIAAKTWDELKGVVSKISFADDWEDLSEKEPFGTLTGLQKAFHIAGHAVTGVLLFTSTIVNSLEAMAPTGENPFATASSVIGFVVTAIQFATDEIAPRYPVEHEGVGGLSIGLTVFGALTQLFFTDTVQKRLAVVSSGFAGLMPNDGRSTAAIIDTIVVIPSLCVTGWHFYELNEKEAGSEQTAAILEEMTNLTQYISTVSYAVAVSVKEPEIKAVAAAIMASTNLIGSGLQIAESGFPGY